MSDEEEGEYQSKYDFSYSVKFIIVGDSHVGKSNILLRFSKNTFDQGHQATLGIEFANKHLIYNNTDYLVQIWDTAGQERFKNIIASYYRGAHGILLIYDVTDKDSFKNLSNWIIEIEKNSSKQVLKVLIGNKTDLEDKRVVTYNQGKEFADTYGLKYIETSAKKNLNVNEAFETLGRELIIASEEKKITKQKQNKKITVAKAQDLNVEKKNGCC